MFPENIVQATFQQVQTEYVPKHRKIVRVGNMTKEFITLKPDLKYTNEINVLGNITNF
jgi:hypothetical protein